MTLNANAENSVGASDSPADAPVFIVGCGRSGTTWLQMLLAQHPAVATAPETHVFSRYLALLDKRWSQETQYRLTHRANTGIHPYLEMDEFYDFLGGFATRVFRGICSDFPNAKVLVEKSPNHVSHLPLIQRCVPRARFIHLIRDPRAVVSSHRAAASGWGNYWASSGIVDVTMEWCEALNAARADGPDPTRQYELRYEDLLERPAEELARILAWLGLTEKAVTVEGYVDACRIDRLQRETEGQTAAASAVASVSGKADFFRRGTARGWERDLSRAQVALVESLAAELMAQTGYQRVAPAWLGACYAWRRWLKRVVRAARWRVDAGLRRLDQRL